MSILVLNRVPLRFIPYDQYLAPSGEDVYVITDIAKVAPDQVDAYRARYAHLELIESYETSGLVEQRAIELQAQVGFSHIVAVSEYDIVRSARLRDRFGIGGQGYQSALAYRDKVRMKELAQAGGIAVPAFRAIETALDVIEFIEEHGYPVVIKPRLGMGSVGTTIVRTPEELHAVLARGLTRSPDAPTGLEVERFVDGLMYHLDGLVHDGRIVASMCARYVMSQCIAFSSGAAHGGMTLDADNPLAPRLRVWMDQLLAALPTPRTTAFHAEVFHTPDDQLVLCEVASRVGGPRIPDIYRTAYEFDLVETFIKGQAGCLGELPGGAVIAPKRVGGELLMPSRLGRLDKAPTACELPGVLDYLLVGEPGTTHTAAHDQNDFIASFLFTAESEAQMLSQIEHAAQWFERETVWSTP